MRTAQKNTSDQVETTLSLEKGEFARASTQGVLEVRVMAGVIWLTSEGRPEDLVLQAGDLVSTKGLSNVLMEAMTDTVLAWRTVEGDARVTIARSNTREEHNRATVGSQAAYSPSKDIPYDRHVPPRAGRPDPRAGLIGNR